MTELNGKLSENVCMGEEYIFYVGGRKEVSAEM